MGIQEAGQERVEAVLGGLAAPWTKQSRCGGCVRPAAAGVVSVDWAVRGQSQTKPCGQRPSLERSQLLLGRLAVTWFGGTI